MIFKALIASVVVAAPTIATTLAPPGSIKYRPCPPFKKGSFDINLFQLYPENADWDLKRCVLYFG